MQRQRYFPNNRSLRPGWFMNYARQLLELGPALGLSPAEVAGSVADALYMAYVSGIWKRAVREFGPACTAAMATLSDEEGATPFVLPVFTAPPLPGAVGALPATVPVPAGALRRIFSMVQTIKARREYTEAMGLQLGIVGAEDATVRSTPGVTTRLEQGPVCQGVRFTIQHYAHEGVVLESRRGGGAWEPLAVVLSGSFVDARPLLQTGVPEVRQYRLRFYDDAAANGDYTDVIGVTVGP